jgi:two-component system phosphate regulon sensor histidine kinase PhoR
MMQLRSRDITEKSEDPGELELLREENARLTRVNHEVFDYIRSKVNSLLQVIGTKSLRPEELDDQSLIEFDPVGILAETFQHVLQNLQETNKKLHFAHDEIQAVFETVGSAVMVLDPQGRIVSYNQKVRDLMLDGDVDMHGKECREYVCQNNPEESRCMFQAVKKNKREQHFSDWSLGGRNFDVIGRPMFNQSGEITHYVLSYHDVTARHEAQNALLESLNETQEAKAKIHGILRSAADGILVTDAANNLVLINRRAEELIGFCFVAENVTTQIDCIPHDDLVQLLRKGANNGQETYTEDLSFQLLGQPTCICQARVTVIRSAEDTFKGCIMLLHDVTEQRVLDRMKDEFISTAAHELRTPLATIIGYADLLLMQDHCRPEEQTEYLGQILKKAERLGEIVSDLLDISRIESGVGAQLDQKPGRLDKLCDEVVKSFQLQSSEHSFVTDFPSSEVTLNFDRYAMMQILENLLSNAVKYSPEGGEVRITLQLKESECLLSVSDQGIGMSSDQIMRVFDKFYRVDATNTAIAGTGLGLTIVKHLVEALSGEINITSTPGHGSTVAITLSTDN